MDIAGGIMPWKAQGHEAPLRASTIVLSKAGVTLAIVSCDVLFVQRDFADRAAQDIETKTGIPAQNILIHATHTHAAPSATRVHGYQRDNAFVEGLTKTIVDSVVQAHAQLNNATPADLWFRLGEESSVGQNSRMLMKDGSIFWIGKTTDAVRPTGPFDPELPVLQFTTSDRKPIALLFNHSTHTIGGRLAGKRSPAFYGLAAQELEAKNGGVHVFLEGASGSTHNLTLSADEMVTRIKNAVEQATASAQRRPVPRLASIKEPFEFRVRTFDDAAEESTIAHFGATHYDDPKHAESLSEVFRIQRREVAPHQGQLKTTWLQTILIGDIAIVGIPAEFFTRLGQEIKRQSPLRYTYVAELSNDWMGYVPDREGFKLGGYQVWTGNHSYCEPGTGERFVEAAVQQLHRITQENRP
jgi:hypothetical protein